ncbi:MAG: DUF3883 domain-containing protein [Tepidisphaeraceae bacterium]
MSKPNVVVFCTDSKRRPWVWKQFQAGQLRQGWAPPGSSLMNGDSVVPLLTWERRYADGARKHWKDREDLLPASKTQTRYRILRLMTGLTRGDLVLVPKMPSDREFTIAEMSRGYEFDDSHYDTPSGPGKDLGHVLPVNPKSLITFRYDSSSDAKIIAGKFRNYRSAVTPVRKQVYSDAITRLYANRAVEGNATQSKFIEAIHVILSKARGQGFRVSPAVRRAVEKRAMTLATKHFENQGYQVEDVHTRESYDLSCTKGAENLLVEVKGSQTDGAEILLTPNEVAVARKNAPKTALIVFHSIEVSTAGIASGGVKVLIHPWKPRDEQLTALVYSCRITT